MPHNQKNATQIFFSFFFNFHQHIFLSFVSLLFFIETNSSCTPSFRHVASLLRYVHRFESKWGLLFEREKRAF